MISINDVTLSERERSFYPYCNQTLSLPMFGSTFKNVFKLNQAKIAKSKEMNTRERTKNERINNERREDSIEGFFVVVVVVELDLVRLRGLESEGDIVECEREMAGEREREKWGLFPI